MIFFTELQNLPIYGVKGEFLGKLEDLCVDPAEKAARVASFLVRTPRKAIQCISYKQIQSISVRAGQTNVAREQLECYAPDEGLLRIKKDVLDQQIIDVNNRKVVRVNDVDLDIEPIVLDLEMSDSLDIIGQAVVKTLEFGLLLKA